MSTQAVRPIEILLVEDDPGDAVMTREALAEGDVHTRLSVVGDGVEAMDFLRQSGSYEDATKPDLILLDLNLPKRDGGRCWPTSRPMRTYAGSRSSF